VGKDVAEGDEERGKDSGGRRLGKGGRKVEERGRKRTGRGGKEVHVKRREGSGRRSK
jgi:hypothetical protein